MLDDKLTKRRDDHAMTIGVWLSSSAPDQQPGEDDREYRRRLISLGAWHAMSPANAPLLLAIAAVARDDR
ncbi:MAG TPA: hypothetical protein PKA33_15950 [Amaricoccus sp.]|uniref:hypothetical protein n=1 Tax=Amaricoccus sp. TaxID=1872485 RepID=UPI002C9F793E|nr:hypothetical protein [Amaricoccus sp.]HMQ92503.1 hypothetical protein [Amaricoccus sp.]HMR53848.1 hypothetical protein [Amaricoccus sp.]HMR58965.1 hypothetical protein [Amaricoccus sp.]HMU00843.1 hypothetical protein [Amaricoccus sp.]